MDRGTQRKPLLIVDPGHGGIKPGAVDPLYGIKEKYVALKVALYFKEWARNRGSFQSYLTRNDVETFSESLFVGICSTWQRFWHFWFPIFI
jgi:N-acetylmuramoyl-L-alanine amidase